MVVLPRPFFVLGGRAALRLAGFGILLIDREVNGGGSALTDVAYISRVKVEPVEGKTRRAQLPAEDEPVLFGVHSEVAEHYGVSPDAETPHSSTLDYLVAAAGG